MGYEKKLGFLDSRHRENYEKHKFFPIFLKSGFLVVIEGQKVSKKKKKSFDFDFFQIFLRNEAEKKFPLKKNWVIYISPKVDGEILNFSPTWLQYCLMGHYR